MAAIHPHKRRRTATGVLAGEFDPYPTRDVLTSLLNGVPKYTEVENDEEARKAKKKEKEKRRFEKEKEKEKERERKRASSFAKPPKDKAPVVPIASTSASAISAAPVVPKRPIAQPRPVTASPFWQARPAIHIPVQRSISITPPPMPSSPPTTPDPSMSSTTSATSSKRPYTPYDGESVTDRGRSVDSSTPPPRPEKKRRVACKKGWKGWVEGSPPPSEKLINLDVVNVLQERKTRSGKNFDAIGVGKEGWV